MDKLVANASSIIQCSPCIPRGFCVENLKKGYQCVYILPANQTQPHFPNSQITTSEMGCDTSALLVITLFTTLFTMVVGMASGYLIGRNKKTRHNFPWETLRSSTDTSIDTAFMREINVEQMKREEKRLFGFARPVSEFSFENQAFDDRAATTNQPAESIEKGCTGKIREEVKENPDEECVLSEKNSDEKTLEEEKEDTKSASYHTVQL